MIDRILSALKRQTNPDKFNRGTITAAESASARYRTSDAPALIARCVDTAAFCIRFNAANLASTQFVLYRKARGGKNTRALKFHERRHVKDARVVGAKAAASAVNAGEVEAVDDHPVFDLLRDPNPRDTAFEVWEQHHAMKETCGNAYLHAYFDGNRPQLVTMLPQFVRVQPDRMSIVSGYYYGRTRAEEAFYEADEVLHERFSKSRTSPIYGEGPLESVLISHDLKIAINQWSLTMFDNGSRPDVLVSFKDSISPDQRARFQDEVRRRGQSTEKAGWWYLADNGATVTPLGWNPKELDYNQSRRDLDTQICTAFGVPETFLRPNDGALSQAREMRRWYGMNTLMPRAIKHAEWLTEWVLPLFTGTDGMWFAPKNMVPEDADAEATRVTVLTNAAVMTINEARREVGLDDIEGGDVLRFGGMKLDAPTFSYSPSGSAAPEADAPTDEAPADDATQPSGAEGVAATDYVLSGIDAERAATMLQQVSTGQQDAEVVYALLVSMGIPEERARGMIQAADAFEPEQPEPDETPNPDGPKPSESPDNEDVSAQDGKALQSPPDGTAEPTGVADRPRDGGGDDRCQGERCGCHPAAPDGSKPGNHVTQRRLALSPDGWKTSASPLYRAAINPIEDACRAFFHRQRDVILAKMEAAPQGYTKNGPRHLAIKADVPAEVTRLLNAWGVYDHSWVKDLYDRIAPHADATLLEAARASIMQLKEIADVDIDPERIQIGSPRAREWARRNTGELLDACEGINRITGELIGSSLAEGIDAGESIAELRRRVSAAFDAENDHGDSMTDYRANMIARTETARAQGHGTLAGWDESGVVEGKEWLLSPTACEFCEAAAAAFNGRTVALNEPFFRRGHTLIGADGGTMLLDFSDVQAPPLHPHDKCAMTAKIRGVP